MEESQNRFVRQQGFRDRDDDKPLFDALMFQPKVIGIVLAIGVLLQNAWLFAVLATVLWWCALAPAYNVFEMLYNRVIADRRGWPHVEPAPEPRRFAQGIATMLSVLIAAALAADATVAALVIEALLGAAVLAIVFARFCFGSWAYWRLHRRLFEQPSARRAPTNVATAPSRS